MNSSDSDARGIASEAMVEQALQTIDKKSLKGLISRVVGFIHATRHSELDKQHIDFLIMLENGYEIPLQVKSSDRGRRKFERKSTTYRRFIPVVVVKLGEAIESIINKVTECIRLAANKLRRDFDNRVHYERIRQKRKTWCSRYHVARMSH